MNKKKLENEVEKHINNQLKKTNWEKLTEELRTLCEDCPAEHDQEFCANCPLEGIAYDAATLALQAKIVAMQSKTIKRRKFKES